MKFWLVPSLTDHNVYFLFRSDKTEIKINIKNNLMLPSKNLTPDEANYIRKQVLLNEQSTRIK